MQQQKKLKNSTSWLWLSLLIVILDQCTKYLSLRNLQPYQPKEILSFFSLTLKYNTGAAYSFLSQHPQVAFWLFSSIAILVSLILLIALFRLPANNHWFACALALVLGGAIGNLIDRLWHGSVVDFLDFYWKTAHFATFNIADSAVTIGACIWLFSMILHKK